MHKSEKAKFTTNMLEGVRKLLTLNVPLINLKLGFLRSYFQENVDNTSITHIIDYAENEIGNSHNMVYKRMLRWKLSPMIVNQIHKILVNSI